MLAPSIITPYKFLWTHGSCGHILCVSDYIVTVYISVIESAGGGGVLQSLRVSEQEETGGGI